MAAKANPAVEGLDEDLEPVADETAERARLVVAGHAKDLDECTMLLNMLGIGPDSTLAPGEDIEDGEDDQPVDEDN